MAQITSSNFITYIGSKTNSHAKAYFASTFYPGSTELLPSVQAFYGLYDELSTAHRTLCAVFGDFDNPASITAETPCTAIPRGFTVAVEVGSSVVEYQYKKAMPVAGYTSADLEVKGIVTGIKKKTADANPITPDNGVVSLNLDADEIAYTPSSVSPNGSIGKKIKELAKAVEDNAGTTIEPVYDATVDLSEKVTAGAHFTYDPDNRYVYNGNPTTMFTYEVTGTLYAVFKVSDSDLFIVYSVDTESVSDEYIFSQTYDTEHLPSAARTEFELGKYAIIKRISGVEGESWRYDTITLLCTRNNNALRHRLLNIALYNEVALDWRVLVKAEDGSRIFIYTKDGSNYRYHSTVASSSVAAFKYYDKFFDYKEASEIGYDDSNTQFGSSTNTVQKAIEKVNKMRYKLIGEEDYDSIDDPTGNTYYDLTTTGQTSIDVSDIAITNNYEVIVLFKTDSQETCSLITDEDQRVIGSTSFTTDTVYVLSVLHGVICICDAPLAPSV